MGFGDVCGMTNGLQHLPTEIVLAQRHCGVVGQKEVALQEVSAQDRTVVGSTRTGVGRAEEQTSVGVACWVDDVALHCVVCEVNVVEVAHQHLPVPARRFQLSVHDIPLSFAIAPFRIQVLVEVVGHLV